MPTSPRRGPRRSHGVFSLAFVLPTVVALLAACGASSNDNSGAGASSSCAASPAGCAVVSGAGTGAGSPASGTTSSNGPGTCTATGSNRTDDFHSQVTLQPPAADGLQVGDIVAGSGAVPTTGQLLTVQYTGWLSDGTVFDSSRKAGRQPFQFALGQSQVIKGWDEGLSTAHVGGVRRLVIPAALGYGAAGSPPVIPANATLTFDIEVLCAG